MIRPDRNSALAALRYVTTLVASARRAHPQGMCDRSPGLYLSRLRSLSEPIPQTNSRLFREIRITSENRRALFIWPLDHSFFDRHAESTVHSPRDQPRRPRPDRQRELLVSGSKRAPPHGPELHARPGFRADQLHEATRHDVAPGTHPLVRPNQQHRSRIQHPLEPGAPRPRLLLPDGDHGRTGGPGPGPLDVRKRAELLDGPDGEDWG